jgi:ferrous-iron efflux pump FieF
MNETSPAKSIEPRYALIASTWVMATVAILICIKGYAYWKSDSAAVLATFTDSLTDAAISFMMLIALRYSLRPADRDHRHGHGKMEAIAALFQAAFLAAAGLFLVFESLRRFAEPQPVTHQLLGVAVAGIAIVLSLLLVLVQNYCLKRAPSLAVEADQAHYQTDVLLNGSVIITLLVNYYGGPAWTDPACCVVIACYYAWTARKIGLQATDMLMDKELPEAVRTKLKEIIKCHPDILDYHDLRTRKSGMVIHITMDVEIDPELTLHHSHEIIRALEHDILDSYPYAEIIIHADPYGDPHDTRHQIVKGALR